MCSFPGHAVMWLETRVVARVCVAASCLSSSTKVPRRQLSCQRGGRHVLNVLLSLTKCVLGKITALCPSRHTLNDSTDGYLQQPYLKR